MIVNKKINKYNTEEETIFKYKAYEFNEISSKIVSVNRFISNRLKN